MVDISSFLMLNDSEKHCSGTSLPHGVDARDGGGELHRQCEPRQELEAMRRKFRLDAQPFGSGLSDRVKRKSKPGGSSGDDGECRRTTKTSS